MDTQKDSILQHAHFVIMLVTLAIVSVMFNAKVGHASPEDSYAAFMSYGYESVSAQYAAQEAGEGAATVSVVQEKRVEKFDYSDAFMAIQYAVESAEDTFDPYGLQPTRLSAMHEKIVTSMPV